MGECGGRPPPSEDSREGKAVVGHVDDAEEEEDWRGENCQAKCAEVPGGKVCLV